MRDEQLTALRPKLSLDNSQTTAVELFQNETFRPILKLQHALLVAIFKHHIAKHKMVFENLPDAKKLTAIEQAVKNDIALKNRLLGSILGYFTLSEYLFFQENESELSRRLTQLLVQRLQSEKY